MSHYWRLSRGQTTPEAPYVAESDNGSNAGPSSSSHLGSAAVEKPLTPPEVRNITPSICLSIVQFRALLQEFRSLDDLVTTRLNRSMAKSRADGLTSSPSILSRHVTSSSSTDLGKSTYASAPEQACLTFWKELVNVWIGREEVLEYCIEVEKRERRAKQQGSGRAALAPAQRRSDAWLLNSDIERQEREAGLSSRGGTSRPGTSIAEQAVVAQPTSKARYDAFDSRASRSEDSADALRRHLNNELAVEAILRKRSLDVYKSRCRFFTPTFGEGKRGDQERAMWEGNDTSAAQQARRTSASI